MRIPESLLTLTATIKPYSGSGAYGPVYGAEFTAKCHVMYKQVVSKDKDGQEVVTSGTAFFIPEIQILAESQITINGRTHTAMEVQPMISPVGGSVHHTEVILGG